MSRILNESPKERTVKRFLRRKDSRQYFTGDGWTTDPDHARTFSDLIEAAETCARLDLRDVEVVLRVGADASDVFCTSVR